MGVNGTDNDDSNMMYTSGGEVGGGSIRNNGGNGGGVQIISSMHMDYINQISLDVYGRRMATCSGDRFVRVWELSDDDNWVLAAQWQAHRGSVSSLCWAHPEFGNLLATAGSSDHDAKIWEEMTPTTTSTTSTNNAANTSMVNANTASIQSSRTSWQLKAALTEARKAVTCCEFAPRHWGLKLAAGSADGCVRIYEAVDIMNLAQWPLAATLQCFTLSGDQDNVIAGSSGNTGMNPRSGSSTTSSALYNPNTSTSSATTITSNKEIGCTSLSWCTGRFEPPTLVVAGVHLLVYRYSETARAWQAILKLPPTNSAETPLPSYSSVLDVSWAPNVGRRFHYIAAAEEDVLRIYKLARHQQQHPDQQDAPTQQQQKSQQQQPQQHLVLENIQIISTNAWRCQWNVTGTVLASSGDGGIVQLWKADHFGRFGCVGKVQGDLSLASDSNTNAVPMNVPEDGQ